MTIIQAGDGAGRPGALAGGLVPVDGACLGIANECESWILDLVLGVYTLRCSSLISMSCSKKINWDGHN